MRLRRARHALTAALLLAAASTGQQAAAADNPPVTSDPEAFVPPGGAPDVAAPEQARPVAAPVAPQAAAVVGVPPESMRDLPVTAARPVDTSDPASGLVSGLNLRRTLTTDPFAAVGIRAGSFIIYPSVEVSGGYTTNTTDAVGGKASGFGIVAPSLILQSDWDRNAASLAIRGSYEAFTNSDVEARPTADIEGTGRIDLADRWQIDLLGRYQYAREDFSDPDFPPGLTSSPAVNATTGSVTLDGGAGPLVMALTGEAIRNTYGDAREGGKVIDQSDRDNTLYAGRFRFGYELTPVLTPFVEGELSDTVFDQRVDSSGLQRSGHGEALRLGLAYDYTPVTKAEIAVGAMRQDLDDARLASIKALSVDGSLVWSPTRLVTLTGALTSGIDPTTNPDSSGSVFYDGAVDVAYLWRDNIKIDGLAGLHYETLQGVDQVDRTWRLGLSATWAVNRDLQVKAAYEHQWLDSSVHPRNYASDSLTFGLTVQR